MAPRVVCAVDPATVDLVADDRVLARALVEAGWECEPRVWGQPLDDLGVDDALIVRSTWDYTARADEFADWLATLDGAAFRVVNPPALMRWNLHKRYLLTLAQAGVPTVPTVLVRRQVVAAAGGRARDLCQLAAKHGWADIVVKPAISATAKGASCGAPHILQPHFDQIVSGGDVLVQPMLASVAERGEWSIVVIDGQVTGAVNKRVAPGEWRVQSDFGGTYEPVAVTDAMRSIALSTVEAIVRVAPAAPAYARIDVVEAPVESNGNQSGITGSNVTGALVVMEAELIEPDLFFALVPDTVDAVVTMLTRPHG